MAVPPADAFLAVAVLAGVVLCGLGAICYRRRDVPGTTAFAAVTVLFGVGAVGGSALAATQDGTISETVVPPWSDFALLTWSFAMVPWFVFAIQYTGRQIRVRWRTVGALAAPVLGVASLLMLGTAASGTCLLYSLLGVDTCPASASGSR